MQQVVIIARRLTLTVLACVIAISSTAGALSTDGTTYNYRALNDVLWYEPGCNTTPKVTQVSNPIDNSDKTAKILIPLFDGGNKQAAMAAIEKYKFGGMAMTGDGRAFDKAFYDEATQKAGGDFIPMADEEGGGVARYKIANKAASEMAKMSIDDIKKEGQRVGEGLKGYGVQVDLAPVVDIEQPGLSNHLNMGGTSRAFGTDAKSVSEKAGAFAAGLSAGGVQPTLKHFPGLGKARANTDLAPATLDYGQLTDDLKPFKDLANQNNSLVMLSNAIITGLGNDTLPAPTNPRLIEKLRGEVGFGGTIITDDLAAVAKWPGQPDLPTLIANSAKAGADLLLFTYPGDATMDKIIEKLKGDVPKERTDEAYTKYSATKSAASQQAATTTPSDTSGSSGGSGQSSKCACSTTSAASAVSSNGGGGGCGEQGYFEGKQLSKANKDQIWSFFKNQGLSDQAVAGIMGNSQIESAFMPDADNGRTMGFQHASTGKGCVGIFQWCDRRPALENFAKERGKEWNCLGIQLEFAWSEVMGSEGGVLEPLKAAKTPTEAAKIWNQKYERSGETGENRMKAAEDIYKEYTGKDASQLGDSGSAGCNVNGAAIMSADCGALVAKYKSLRGSRLTETDSKSIDNDLANCTTGEIQCGTGPGQGGGVNPNLLRAVIAVVENSGDEPVRVWNMNTRHPCDGLNHPHGKASDLYCHIPSMSNRGEGPSKEKCERMFKYLYDHYDELGLSELIWNEDLPYSKMGDGKHTGYVAGHEDHIHIGVK